MSARPSVSLQVLVRALVLSAAFGAVAVVLQPRAAALAPVPAQASKPLPPELALIPHDAVDVTTARPRAILARVPAAEPKDETFYQLAWLMSVLVGVADADIERVTEIVPPDALPPVPKDVKDRDKRPEVTPDPGGVFDVPPKVRYRTIVLTTRRALPRLPYQALGAW